MSNWITDNKPAAMVAGVGLLLFLGLSATGYIVNSKRSELDKKISIAAKEIKSANAAEITPSRSSNEELEKELNRYAKAVGSLETAYKPFLASSALAPTTPTAFQNELKTFRDSLISSCKKKNILITDTSSWLGFQVYSTQAPSVQAASTLGFELKAINSLVNKLAECGLSKFIKQSGRIGRSRPGSMDSHASGNRLPGRPGKCIEGHERHNRHAGLSVHGQLYPYPQRTDNAPSHRQSGSRQACRCPTRHGCGFPDSGG